MAPDMQTLNAEANISSHFYLTLPGAATDSWQKKKGDVKEKVLIGAY